ncbi:MAG: ethanolamine utilization protein EutQ [Gammaproteobacteria bacterium]|nr:ethanolamine utilization protein EutQ [Gammaproteobacteria bacterium]
MTISKSPLQLWPFNQMRFTPRFEYGEMAELVEICGSDNGSEMAAGWCRFRKARIPWTIQYDEVLTVFEGNLKLHANGEIYDLGVKDSIWLPTGTELIYEAESALVYYAAHPANW